MMMMIAIIKHFEELFYLGIPIISDMSIYLVNILTTKDKQLYEHA